MSGLFFGINIGLKGIMAQQAAINVTSHNVANANTPGYTRQRAFMETSYPVSGIGAGQLGSGVEVGEIQRLRDEFIDYQIRTESSKLGTNSAISNSLSQIETVFMEPTDSGFNELMNDFWNGFQELSKHAESSPIRTTVKEVGVSLTDSFRHMSDQLEQFKADSQMHIDIKMKEVNSIGRQISELNDKIISIKLGGDNPNDLLDSRDVLLDQLSSLGNIKITPLTVERNGEQKESGAIKVEFGDKTLVTNTNKANELGNPKVVLENGELAGMAVLLKTENANGDPLGTDSIKFYSDKLDSLALGIAKAVNDIHKDGVDLAGKKGEDFFIFKNAAGDKIEPDWDNLEDSNISAANIFINPAIEKDVSKIAAASGTGDDFAKGNGDIALKIAKLQSTALKIDDNGKLEILEDEGGGTNFSDFYKDMVSELGVATKEAYRTSKNQGVLVNQLEMRRESSIGVSQDEEMANLISFQHAYQANAKVISTMDQLLQTVINMKQ